MDHKFSMGCQIFALNLRLAFGSQQQKRLRSTVNYKNVKCAPRTNMFACY